jgi:hypothetical protein
MAKAIDWRQYDQLKAQGLADREIARRWGIPWGPSIGRSKSARVDRPPSTVDPDTWELRQLKHSVR